MAGELDSESASHITSCSERFAILTFANVSAMSGMEGRFHFRTQVRDLVN